MEKITLFQPRHNAAPEHGKGNIYLPTSLLMAASRLMKAGVEPDIQDGNLRPLDIQNSDLGLSLVGAPYIPIAIEIKKMVQAALGDNARFFLGGQVVSGLSKDQFARLFGKNAYDGNSDQVLAAELRFDSRTLPVPEETSLIPAYEKISDEDFHEYLSHEFCLYLSQGCKYSCSFCAAKRTSRDPLNGKINRVKECYRSLPLIEEELKYLVDRAKRLNINSFEIYLSNLDLFQTPQKLKRFAEIVSNIKKENPGFKISLRGLSTTKAFMQTYHHDQSVIRAMKDAGLWSIGFGVDGISKIVWRQIKKGHNQKDECIDAIRITRREFNIMPEVFMVVGHGSDTPQTMLDDVEFLLDMSEHFQAPPRPYVAKNLIPGNSGWADPANREAVEEFIHHPEYFRMLDYAALPSPLTHPDPQMRAQIEKAYRMMTDIPGNTTNIIYPVSPDLDPRSAEIHRRLNRGKSDR